jgi:hypothetical protein
MPQTPPVDDIMSKFSFPARKPSCGSGAPPTPVSPRAGRSGRSPSLTKVSEGPSGLGIDHERSPGRTSNLRVSTDTQPPNRIDLKSPSDDSEYDNIASSRLIPAQSVNGTPRSSGEFYSMSNSTTETLISEYDPKNSRFSRNTHNRRHSLLSVGSRQVTDTLMMGYAQVMGSFTLDGSLVQSNIFEDVKRKGVVGTHSGGGVVGIETNKTDGGFLSGFGWGGFGGLLGGSNMSTIAEMKSSASKFPQITPFNYILTPHRWQIHPHPLYPTIDPLRRPPSLPRRKSILSLQIHPPKNPPPITPGKSYQNHLQPNPRNPTSRKRYHQTLRYRNPLPSLPVCSR